MGTVLAMGLELVTRLLSHLVTIEWGQCWLWGWCWLWGLCWLWCWCWWVSKISAKHSGTHLSPPSLFPPPGQGQEDGGQMGSRQTDR